MSFSLKTATQTGAAVIRVIFDGSMPLSTNPLGSADATNPSNWSLQGPNEVVVGEVRAVPSNPFGFDLICETILAAGSWILAGTNITTVAGATLETATATFASVGAGDFFSVPSQQITSETTLRQALNAAFDGPGWRAFITALAYSDELVSQAGKAAFYQRLLATASGEYLERLTTQTGIDRPPNVGMSDDVLRTMTIALNNNKVNSLGIEAVLTAYYGVDATVAHAQSLAAEPYALTDGDSLIFTIDDIDVEVFFSNDDFSAIGAAGAEEVAAVINRRLWIQGRVSYAKAFVDTETGSTYLRIYSGEQGIVGKMRFYGGDAMRVLRMPDIVDTQQTVGTTWSIEPSSSINGVPVGQVRLTWTAGTDPGLVAVFPNDYVNIYGSPFAATNLGTYKVTSTTPTYIDFEGADFATAQTGAIQVAAEDVFFTRPRTISLNGQYAASVVRPDFNVAEILLPATAAVVERDALTAWYLNGESTIELDGGYAQSGRLSGTTTVRIKTVTPHGLSTGRFFFLDEVELDYGSNVGAVQVTLGAPPVAAGGSQVIKLADGTLFGIFATAAGIAHSCYLFNATTSTWVVTTATPFGANNVPGVMAMSDGRVFGVGKTDYSIYDPEALVWTSLAALPFGSAIYNIAGTGAAELLDGRIMVVATRAADFAFLASIFDPDTLTWTTPVSPDPARVANATLVSVVVTAAGDVVVVGGGVSVPQDEAAYYNTASDTWRVIASMPFTIGVPRGIAVRRGPAGQIWVTGAQSANDQIAILDVATLTWTTKALVQAPALNNYATLVERQGEVYWIPGPSTLSWELVGSPSGLPSRVLTGTTGPVTSFNAHDAHELPDGRIVAVGQMMAPGGTTRAYMLYADSRVRSSGHLAGGPFKVTAVPSTTILEFATPESTAYAKISGGKIMPVLAETYDTSSGFMLNVVDGVAITETLTATTAVVAKGYAPAIMEVADASGFPDSPGYLVLQFGYTQQSQAVRYLGIASSTQIRLDPNERLPYSYPVGTSVNLLAGKGVYAPSPSTGLGVTWLTDSSVGRVQAISELYDVVGVGYNVTNNILYPGDRGLGNEGLPTRGVAKISDVVTIWGGANYLDEASAAREDE